MIASILASLVPTINPFTIIIDELLLQSIRNSTYIVLDLETTGLTKYAKPVAVGKSAKIGPNFTWNHYQKVFGGKVNCTPRARIFAFQLSNGIKIAVDIDAIPKKDAEILATTLLAGKTIIGHNLSFDLSWLKHYTNAVPALVLDTLLITRCMKPGISWRVYERAAKKEAAACKLVLGMVDNSASLETLSVATGLGEPDKTWQHPRNWCVENLSVGHFDYVVSDVDMPLQLLKHYTKRETFDDIVAELRRIDNVMGGTYFRIYSKVPETLAQMHINGMPLNDAILENVHQHRGDAIERLANEVISLIPALIVHEKTLKSLATSLPATLKIDLSTYLKDNGFDIDDEEGNPVLNSKVVKITGASVLDGWKAWEKLQSAKKALGFCQEFRSVSVVDADYAGFRRLHPLISASTVTMRTNSKLPNSQNLPRPEFGLDDMLQIRTAIHARDGHVLVSADYGQIELRIAAALAQRAYQETLNAIANGGKNLPEWMLDTLKLAESDAVLTVRTLKEGEERSFDDYKTEVALAWRAVKKSGMVMANIFRKEIDPHLATGVGMAVKQGLMESVGDVVEYMGSASKDILADLKKNYKAQRQAAKALNFGLLYGMGAEKLWTMGVTDYMLSWTNAEAKEARDAWFDMFADIKWWQIWESVSKKASAAAALKVFRRNTYTKELEYSDARLLVTKTLAGRPVVSIEKRGALNYSDQGTGADMALMALINIPTEFKHTVINIIHDEIMLEVPVALADGAEAMLQRVMLDAADFMLSSSNIPAEAEPGRSVYWKKE